MVLQLNMFGSPVNIPDTKIKKNKKKKAYSVKKKIIRKYLTLEYAYFKLFNILDINILEQKETVIKGLLIAYPDELQAEVIGTQRMNINQRVKFYSEFVGGIDAK